MKSNFFALLGFALLVIFSSCEKPEKDNSDDIVSPQEKTVCYVNSFNMNFDGEKTVVSVNYDSLGKVKSLTEYDADSTYFEISRYIRNSAGLLTKIEYVNDQQVVVGYSEFNYNANNQLIEIRSAHSSQKVQFEYNQQNQLAKQVLYYYDGIKWVNQGYLTFGLDANGNIIGGRSYEMNANSAVLKAEFTITYDSKVNPWKNLELLNTYYDLREFIMFSSQHNVVSIKIDEVSIPFTSNTLNYKNSYDQNNNLIKQVLNDDIDALITYELNYNCANFILF